MTNPLPPEILSPDGVPLFLNPYKGTYSKSRSYALRMQRDYSRGMPQQAARGHRPVNGLSESQLRSQRSQLAYGMKPWQRFAFTFKQRWGFEYRWWRYLKRHWIDAINSMTSPSQVITPVWISQELTNAALTGHNEAWIEQRLSEKLYAMERYRMGDAQPGGINFSHRDGLAPIEWWFYH